MRLRESCDFKCTSSLARRPIARSFASSCSFFIFLPRKRICIDDLRTRFPQAESKLFKKALTFTSAHCNVPLIGKKLGNRLTVPKVAAQHPIGWAPSQPIPGLLELLSAESPGSAGPVPVSQAGKAFFFKSFYPIGDRPGNISQKPRNLRATPPLRVRQDPMQSVVVACCTPASQGQSLILKGKRNLTCSLQAHSS